MEKNKETIFIDEDIEDLIPSYLENTRNQLKRIKALLDQSNFLFIKKAAHQLKGSGKSYGFNFISEHGKKIEDAATNKEVATISEKISDLYDYLDNIIIEFVPEDDI